MQVELLDENLGLPGETRLETAIQIVGARTHNLKNVSLTIPHHQLTVLTGVSGSGKSSLAIDTLYAEGQRQYIESLSTYARQFLNQLERPDVERIDGLQPTLCIDQKAGATNPRSTVATVTEVYDYLRLLMARAGTPHCYSCGKPIVQQSPDRIGREVLGQPEGTKLVVMAPVVRGRRGGHRDELNAIRKAGLIKVRVDGETYDVDEVPELAVRKNHTIEAIVDKIVVRPGGETRVTDAIQLALTLAKGLVSVSYLTPEAAQRQQPWAERLFSTLYACPDCGVSYEELEPRTFSFNSPYGACPDCDGVGTQARFDSELLVADWETSPKSGAFAFLDAAPDSLARRLTSLARAAVKRVGARWDQSLDKLNGDLRRRLFEGDAEHAGLLSELAAIREQADDEEGDFLDWFQQPHACATCGGARLRSEALAVTFGGKNIFEICSLSIAELEPWLAGVALDSDIQTIARPILADVMHRLRFLNKVGVGYLSLARRAGSLSGGELQRVRLATSIGSGLVGVSYILDEPSIGLHQRDNDRLIDSLRDLQQQGNTVIVVEHDEAMMRAADLLVDVGPGAGQQGGEIVACGTPAEVEQVAESITAQYLRGELRVERDSELRTPKPGQHIRLKGATLHNLKAVDVDLPLGLLVGVTGVSGSGKSSLFSETLVPAILRSIDQAYPWCGPYRSLSGVEQVDKLIEITQKPIGRSPRSTPATFCGVFDLIRKVWANTRDAKLRGYTSTRFSFNAGSGRCAQCQGQGQEKIEMNFLPDLYVKCSVCNGSRYNRQTLSVRYRERSIADVLDMSVDEAADFFSSFTKISRMLDSLRQVGLGYLTLGQSSSTLSGGEAQRIKLATELARQETGNTIYFLDEPTTGLHFADVHRLIGVLDGLVSRGNTVIVIEHNLDVIRACDWLIDMGPEGGEAGGEIIATGPPAEVAQTKRSLTGRYLAELLQP